MFRRRPSDSGVTRLGVLQTRTCWCDLARAWMLPVACSLRLAHMRSTSFQLAQRLSSGISSYPGGWKAQRRASARVSLWPRAIWTFHNLRSTPQSFALIMSGDIASLSSASLELDKVAPFLIKLFEIVSSPASNCLISWSEMGDSFRIIDRTKFAQVSAATGWGEWHSPHFASAVIISFALGRTYCLCTSSTTTCVRSSGS